MGKKWEVLHFRQALFIGLLACILFFSSFGFTSAEEKSFDVLNVLLKVSVEEGSIIQRVLSIRSDSGGEFFIEKNNLEGVSISETNFVLNEGGSKSLNVLFDANSIAPGVNVGNFLVRSGSESVKVPVINEIESTDLFFDVIVDIPPNNVVVNPGDKIIAQMKIVDLTDISRDGSEPVDLEYYVYDIDGKSVISQTESLAVQGQTQFTKVVPIPADMKEGSYVFAAIVKYGSSIGASSYLFNIEKEKEKQFFNGNNTLVLFVGGTILILALIFIFAFYLIRVGDRLTNELRKHNAIEAHEQRKLLNAQRKILERKAVPKREIKREIKKKIRALREKHKKRVNYFRKLKKEGKTAEMEKKLKEWRSKGYNTLLLESKINRLNAREMRSLMDKWRKQ